MTFTHAEPEKLLAHLEGHGVLAHAIAPGTVRFVTHRDVDDAGVARAIAAVGRRAVKVRIGISAGGESLGPDAMVALAQGIAGTGFDSLWLPEVLTRPGPDPLVGLAWVSGACPGLKIGTTMLLPGRNLVWLAKAVATLDVLSGGRFLLTFVPGLGVGGERSAIGIPSAARAEQMEDALPVLRRLWAGEVVSHEGPAGSFADVSVSPRPAQDPFDVWLGGNVPAALERCGRLADGWIPAFCTAADAAAGKAVIDRVAGGARARHQPRAFRRQPGLRTGRDRRRRAGVVTARPPGPRPTARGDHPRRPPGPALDAGAVPRGRILQVHRAPDGAAGGVASRARAPG